LRTKPNLHEDRCIAYIKLFEPVDEELIASNPVLPSEPTLLDENGKSIIRTRTRYGKTCCKREMEK
jgi:hypothetical protein